jgi:hypothetical protein
MLHKNHMVDFLVGSCRIKSMTKLEILKAAIEFTQNHEIVDTDQWFLEYYNRYREYFGILDSISLAMRELKILDEFNTFLEVVT